jgi:DNA-directed RNA polymerase beta subunit
MSERAERIHFGSIKEGIEPPNLIEVQLNSYVDFLQKDVPFNKRKNYGLQAVFKEFFQSRATMRKRRWISAITRSVNQN